MQKNERIIEFTEEQVKNTRVPRYLAQVSIK